MNKPGILEGAVRTTLNLAGAIPVGIVHGLSQKGGPVDTYMTEHRDGIRQVVGAGIIAAGVGCAVVD